MSKASLDLETLSVAELYDLQSKVHEELKDRIVHESEHYKDKMGRTFQIIWPPENNRTYPGKLKTILDNGWIEVEFLMEDEEPHTYAVTPFCIKQELKSS